MASSSKKQWMSDEPECDILKRFWKETDEVDLEILKESVHNLCNTRLGAIASLTIQQCNAAYGRYGMPGKTFSRADVEIISNTEPGDKLFCFGTIFRHGYNMLQGYLKNPNSVPSNPAMRSVLSKLLEYLLDKDEQNHLKSIMEKHRSEGSGKLCKCELSVRLAQHFFSKLSSSSSYTLNQNCDCNTPVLDHYGDTGIGNVKIWHGNLDILLGSCYLPVLVFDGDNPDSSGGNSCIGVKNKDIELEPDTTDYIEQGPDITSQLLAQTIVFSFAQKKKHPELNNFLIPSIGVSKSNIIFYFYDSEHDILLKSPSLSLFEANQINMISVLATWFVVNYQYLCSGFSNEMLNETKKANFFEHAVSQLPFYQNEVSLGGVSSEPFVLPQYHPWFLMECPLGKAPTLADKSHLSEKLEEETKLDADG